MASLTSLKQLQYLVAISKTLNFTRAAQACFVTQSTLSAGLKELEDALGVQLVERDRQTVLMTPIGVEIAERAQAILVATQDVVKIATEARLPMTGLMRLGVIPTIAPFILPPALSLLREHYPQLRVALREDLTANLLSRLGSGQLDVALIALPVDTGSLKVEPLFDDELWVVGRKGDSEVKARRVNVTSSLTDRLLLLEEGHCLRDHALYACGTPAHPSAQELEATSLLTLVQMVDFGLGIGLIPEMAVHSGLIKNLNLIARPLAKPSPKRTIALVARQSSSRLADLKVLGEMILKSRRNLAQAG